MKIITISIKLSGNNFNRKQQQLNIFLVTFTYLFKKEETGVGSRIECVRGNGAAGQRVELMNQGAHLVRGLVHVDAGGKGVLNRQDIIKLRRKKRQYLKSL